MTARASVFTILVCPVVALAAAGQRTVIYDDNIKTVCLSVGDAKIEALPVMRLGSADRLQVNFDELSHDYHRYTYKIEHLDADFKTEDGLFESDYAATTAEAGLIEDYAQSMNTSVLYTHYSFSLPNRYMRPLLSGNYALTVCDEAADDPERPVLRTYFYVTEEVAGIGVNATTDTDIDRNATHQQLDITATWRGLSVRDARREVRLVVLQNGWWESAVVAPPPTGQTADALIWEHAKPLIFAAGNEYRKFEVPSTRYPGMHADAVRFYDPYYHVGLMADERRRNYLYDEDRNGRFVALAEDGDPATAADYVWVHFALDTAPYADSRLYVDGRWTYDRRIPAYEMHYNEQAEAYTADVLLKQGYYSYRYVVAEPDGKVTAAPIEGDFFQTENEYTVLVYYRPAGGRYERLIGYRTISYRPQ